MSREAWLEWRRQGIGASDAPVIMEVSPWTTPYQLWEVKTGLVIKEDTGNWATDRGNRLEEVARSLYELKTGFDIPPKLVTHPEHEWIRASLDGYNETHNFLVEIKCPGADDHAKAMQGLIPEKYYPQIQHQLLASGAAKAHYISYDGADSLVIVEILPDGEYINQLYEKERDFWDLVTSNTAPELSPRDVKVIDTPGLLDLANRYIELDEQAKGIEKEMKAIKAQLSEDAEVSRYVRCSLNRLNITRTVRKGAVDYEAIGELEGVDLDAYRKKGTSSLTFTIKRA
jgi:putative phage-type endonuclease